MNRQKGGYQENYSAPQLPKGLFKDNRTAGFALYSMHCASCHGMDGIGKDNLAPPLLDSENVSESKDRLIALTLNGV
ncbi:MAG: cytochrome c [Bacteroidia bacterium]|nr:cytochrome c [Bacteroidia bacterium]